jgi:hypothetical protein
MKKVPVSDPPDLSLMDENSQSRECHAWAGLALYEAQVLEQGVLNLLFAARVAGGSLAREFASADSFFGVHGGKTLGQLLNRGKNHVPINQDANDKCVLALRTRNFLVHAFFVERIELFFTFEGRTQAVGELHDMAQLFQAADSLLADLMLRVARRFGLTEAQIDREFQALKAEIGG